MPKYIPISPKTVEGKSWMRNSIERYQGQALLPVMPSEIMNASGAFPLAFVRTKAGLQIVAVCGQEAEHNLFIKQGKWLGNYVPEFCMTYPFQMVVKDENGILIFDEESGLMRDDTEGEVFFDAEGKPAGALEEIVKLLTRAQAMAPAFAAALKAIDESKLLMPWPKELADSAGIKIKGLQMVNEKALAELSDEDFLKVRKSLPIIYAVNLSLSQRHLLVRLGKLNPKAAAVEDVATMFEAPDDTLKFNF